MFRTYLPMFSFMVIGVAVAIALTDRNLPQAQAMTAHGTENKTMITVPLDSGMEAVVTLDHTTGDMTGYVLNRFNRQFFIRYRHNVGAEFPSHSGAYLMAAGVANFRGFTSNERLASGVVYVSEEISQRVVAYAIPWHSQLATNDATTQELPFIPIDQATTRFTDQL